MNANPTVRPEAPLPLAVSIEPTDLNAPSKSKPWSKLTDPLLVEMLQQLSPIEFRDKLDLKEDEKLSQALIAVAVVEEILEKASKANWGLCQRHDFIYLYNGAYWRELERDELKTFLGEAAEKMGYKRAQAKRFEFREKLYKQFISDARLPTFPQDFDTVLINLKNGTFEINKNGGRLRTFKSEDFLTYQLPFEYNPKAQCQTFRQFMEKVLPDQSLQNVLAEFFGYVFTKHMKLEKCLFVYGTGANGKSVLFEVINAILGRENISSYSLSNLKEEHNRAQIANKLLNYGSEIKAGIEADEYKLLVSGEPIQARMKYGNSFEMRNYAKLAFNCNTLPKDVEHTNAYFRRFLIVPFEVTIPEKEQDHTLAKRIIDKELPGVFNWILEGLDRLLKNGKFTESQKSKETLDRYKQESDSVYLFIEEKGLKPSIDRFQNLAELYAKYKDFCKEDGYFPLGRKNFSERLRKHGFNDERKSIGMVFYLEISF